VVGDLHRERGVDLRLGTGVEALHGDAGGRASWARLTDGTTVEADVVLVGIGVTPNTAWLEGSGLDLGDGVVCDETCLAGPGVVAAGDVARWPHPQFGGGDPIRIEQCDNAQVQGAHAARTLLADLAGGRGQPFAPVPWFWSDQYDRKIQVVGRTSADCDVEVVAGSIEARKFVALYGCGGRLVAALGMNMPAQVVRWRQVLVDGGVPWADALAVAAA
nr:FAD-dependent oxidoreductase [Acidimicrobiia bacterium]